MVDLVSWLIGCFFWFRGSCLWSIDYNLFDCRLWIWKRDLNHKLASFFSASRKKVFLFDDICCHVPTNDCRQYVLVHSFFTYAYVYVSVFVCMCVNFDIEWSISIKYHNIWLSTLSLAQTHIHTLYENHFNQKKSMIMMMITLLSG